MYTKNEWIEMLKEVNSLVIPYKKLHAQKQGYKFSRYYELLEQQDHIKDDTGIILPMIYLLVVILGFVFFGWLFGLLVLFVGGIAVSILEKLMRVEKKREKKLKEFEKKYGKEMEVLRQEMEDIENALKEIETNASYLVLTQEKILIEHMSLEEDAEGVWRSELIHELEKDEVQILEEAVTLVNEHHR